MRVLLELMESSGLVTDQLPSALRPVVEDLLRRKRAGREPDTGPPIVEINEFVEEELSRLRETLAAVPRVPKPDWELLDSGFRDSLREAWAPPSCEG